MARKFMRDDLRYKSYDIGKHSYGEPSILGWGGATFKIGKFSSIAKDVLILLGGNHRIDWVSTYPFTAIFKDFSYIKGHPATKGDVLIGNDVWIGTRATVLSGVAIGDGAVVGANAVVSKSIPPYGIAVGNPAKIVKKRFSDGIIGELLKIKWWDWEFDKIKKNLPLILNSNIEYFIKKHRG